MRDSPLERCSKSSSFQGCGCSKRQAKALFFIFLVRTSMKKIYISGPITGHPNFERDFLKAEIKLLTKGFKVVNPVRVGNKLEAEIKRKPTYAEFMQADLAELLKCDAIYLLPGWQQSNGALIEASVAYTYGKTLYTGKMQQVVLNFVD